jgi:4-amino-4-deoxy-L-arabinose transferase-like glycosyltransferase
VAEREWREASDLRVPVVNLALVLLIAVLLRLWSIGYGLPATLTPAERTVLDQVLGILKLNQWQPAALDPSPLLAYFLVPLAIVRFLTGVASGWLGSLADLDAGALALWARALVALVGSVTVWIVFQIGLRWGARHALLGAGLMAVMPSHVRASHFATPEVPAVFFLALTILLSLRACERTNWRAFLLAGVTAGLAFAMNPALALALIVPVVAAWMTLTALPSRRACVAAAVGGAAAAYVVSFPFVITDLPWALEHAARRVATARATFAPWWEPAVALLRELGVPALLLMVGGLALGVVRAINGPGRARWTIITGFPLVAVLIGGSVLTSEARLLMVLPAVCMLAAIAVVSGVSQLRRFDIARTPRTALIAALTVAALLPPLISALVVARDITQPRSPHVATGP